MASDRAHEQAGELAGWITSTDARAAARSELRRHDLPHDPAQADDVLADVAEAILQRLQRTGPLDGNVVAYARRSITNAVVDLLRGRREVSLDELLDDRGAPPTPLHPPTEVTADELPADADVLARLRRSLHATLAAPYVKDWYVAACLALVVVSQDDVPLAADIPRPSATKGGAAQPALWAALAYAGQDQCFAQPDTPAVRERRSKAIKQIEKTIDRALADATAAADIELGATR